MACFRAPARQTLLPLDVLSHSHDLCSALLNRTLPLLPALPADLLRGPPPSLIALLRSRPLFDRRRASDNSFNPARHPCSPLDHASLYIHASSTYCGIPLRPPFAPSAHLEYNTRDTQGATPMEERLQKIMAQAGLGSRRACEELIRQGRVQVDGQIATLGQKVDPARQRIVVDGQALVPSEPLVYVALHKPRGVLAVSHDDRGRRTVCDLVPLPRRLYPVGRLDALSEGLILLTNDGRLANRLTHPRYAHEKEYHVRVQGEPSDATLEQWRRGVYLDGRRTAPARVTRLRQEKGATWLRVVLREGRKRQIRRVALSLGHPVLRLIRQRIGPLRLGKLEPGQWRHLTNSEIKALRRATRNT